MRRNPIVSLLGNAILDYFQVKEETKPQPNAVPELGDIKAITDFRHEEGAVALILGRRKSGKTICAYRLAEIIGRPTYAISPEEKPPDWIEEISLEKLEDMPPPWSTLIMDDLPTYASQRDYTDPSVRALERLIPVVRKRRKIILIFSSQASSLSDRYVTDAELNFLKPKNLLLPERPEVARLYKEVMPIFDSMSVRQNQRHVFLWSQAWRGLARVNLPQSS